MGDPIFRQWLALKGSGWFSPGMTGGLFPFPETWQGWLTFGLFLVAIAATGLVHSEVIIGVRVVLCLLYIALGFTTFA